jgi:hypothetical protein
MKGVTMTGFQRRTFLLDFEDPSFGGLQVRTRSANLGFLARMEELMRTPLAAPEHADDLDELFVKLSSLIISWNLLDDHNEPVGTTPADLAKEEWPLVRQICRAWIMAVADVPAPLSQPSSDGDRLADLQIPMETLSPNPPSSPPPSES